MKIAQRLIIKILLISLLCIVFFILLFLSIKTLPPILINIAPIVSQRGDIITVKGIALSNANSPTKIYINDTLVIQENIIHQSFFRISFKIDVESGAKYVHLKKGNSKSGLKLLIVRSLSDEFAISHEINNILDSIPSIQYHDNNPNTFILEKDATRIFSSPLQSLQFETTNTLELKNMCSISLSSNIFTSELPKYSWKRHNNTLISISLPELLWFNYNAVSNTRLIFLCNSTERSFPITLNSMNVTAEDISAFYEMKLLYPNSIQGARYMLPIQSRSQRRNPLKNNSYNNILSNYLISYTTHTSLNTKLTVTPLVLKNTADINFEQSFDTLLVPHYLQVSKEEKALLDKISITVIPSTLAIIRSISQNPSLQIQDIHVLKTTLSREIHNISNEAINSYVEQRYKQSQYIKQSLQQQLHMLLMARILNRYNIPTRTILGSYVKKTTNKNDKVINTVVDVKKNLLVWLEFYSRNYGWLAVQNEYKDKAFSTMEHTAITQTSEQTNTTNNNSKETNTTQEDLKTLYIPKNLLHLYILEELLWLEQHKQNPVVPLQINFFNTLI